MWKYLKKYWIYVVISPVIMMGEALMDLLQPAFMSRIVDEGVLGLSSGGVGDISLVLKLGIQMIGLVLIGGFCGFMTGVTSNIATQNFGNDMRKDVFSKIMSFSFDQTDHFTIGSLITRVTNDITQIQTLVMMSIRMYVRTFVLLIGGIICMLSLNLSFGVVLACAMPVVLLIVVGFLWKLNPRYMILQERLDKVNNVVQENVSGARVVKAYVQEKYEEARFERANSGLVGTQLDILLLISYMTPLLNIVMNVSVIAVIKVGAIEVQNGAATPGVVMAAITYLTQILGALMRLGMMFQSVSRGTASWKRVKEVLECESTLQDGSLAQEASDQLPPKKGEIEFRNVSFAYPENEDKVILENISFTVNPGETVGILGETGSGKSSLVYLIPRFYDVTAGQVLVDGADVRDYPIRELRSRISFALQKAEVFHDTIRENISWGDRSASMEQIKRATEIAQAAEFISQKEEGMDTMISQDGHSISGGQKQRVSISRAVLRDSEILILDDATSALDLKTESNLYRELEQVRPDQTRIIIAQRIASVRNADRILVLDGGRIAASGSHEELLSSSEIYREIYNSQLKGAPDGE